MDFFNEWIVKKKKSVQDIMTIIVAVMAAVLILYFVLIQFSVKKLIFFVPIEIAVVIYVLYVFGHR